MTPEPSLSYLQTILLGFLQGLTEFLPVSSTAHMDIVPRLFHMQDPGSTFSAIAQLGPIVAIILYFRSDLVRYAQGILRTPNPLTAIYGRGKRKDLDARLGWFTLLGTIPACIFGVLLEKKIDKDFRTVPVVAASMIILGLILLLAELVAKGKRTLNDMTFNESQVIGWAQVMALVPGASRSGVTITAGLFQGLDRESAARFSFLLSIPVIVAAGVFKLAKAVKSPDLHSQLGPDLVGALVAGLVAYAVIRWFLGYMKEHNTMVFIVYRIVVGIALFILLKVHYLS